MLAETVAQWPMQWKNEGKIEGLIEGKIEGKNEGETLIFLRLFSRKFGPVSENFRERIQNAKENDLFEWSDRLFYANTPEEVFGKW